MSKEKNSQRSISYHLKVGSKAGKSNDHITTCMNRWREVTFFWFLRFEHLCIIIRGVSNRESECYGHHPTFFFPEHLPTSRERRRSREEERNIPSRRAFCGEMGSIFLVFPFSRSARQSARVEFGMIEWSRVGSLDHLQPSLPPNPFFLLLLVGSGLILVEGK